GSTHTLSKIGFFIASAKGSAVCSNSPKEWTDEHKAQSFTSECNLRTRLSTGGFCRGMLRHTGLPSSLDCDERRLFKRWQLSEWRLRHGSSGAVQQYGHCDDIARLWLPAD